MTAKLCDTKWKAGPNCSALIGVNVDWKRARAELGQIAIALGLPNDVVLRSTGRRTDNGPRVTICGEANVCLMESWTNTTVTPIDWEPSAYPYLAEIFGRTSEA